VRSGAVKCLALTVAARDLERSGLLDEVHGALAAWKVIYLMLPLVGSGVEAEVGREWDSITTLKSDSFREMGKRSDSNSSINDVTVQNRSMRAIRGTYPFPDSGLPTTRPPKVVSVWLTVCRSAAAFLGLSASNHHVSPTAFLIASSNA
jgi:hypothetical protein